MEIVLTGLGLRGVLEFAEDPDTTIGGLGLAIFRGGGPSGGEDVVAEGALSGIDCLARSARARFMMVLMIVMCQP